ncbi:speriolin isoform X2 [Monodelphis domestica]|uniref:speriolin isoform X2 n=1 Tax=Monodelphis domestica TaxID=13616 RepID=UPI0024E1D77F|nr:speriolin isoform X2 [Monodelphis domestica]
MPPNSPGLRPRPPGRSHSTISIPIPRTMSLLSNYEGLRHQIERLVRENEELKKLVRLIRENHELKSAIKTQAGAMGISGLTSMLGDGTTSSTSRTPDRSVFTPLPAGTPVHEPGLNEIGIMTLSSLSDVLNNSQSNSVTSSLTGPLPVPLSTSLPANLAVPTNNTLLNFLNRGLVPCSPNAFPNNMLPESVANSLANAPVTNAPLTRAIPGSMALPSPTNSSLSGVMTNALTAPASISLGNSRGGSMAVPPISPLSGSLNSSLAAPLANSQVTSLSSSIPGSPGHLLPGSTVNNILLIDSNRPHSPLDAARQVSTSPTNAANTVPSVMVPKVKISTDYNKVALGWDTSSNVDPFNASFVNPPTQASTPSAVAPNTVFFGPPDSSAKRSISDKSSALASAPMADVHSPPGLPASSNSQATSTSLPQGAITSPSVMNASIHSDTAHGVQHTHRLTSPTRIAHATQASFSPPTAIRSPRASNSSPSANDAQGPRSSENPQRRSLIEMERKMAQRKSSKFNDCPRDNKQLAGDRLVGEIAFQLDRRILSSIFPERVRLYGFTVSNIPEKIIQASLNSNHKLDEELCQTLTQRYVSVMNRLQSLGYNGRVHPGLTEQLVNAYGILRERPELAASESGSYTMDFLQQVVMETVPHSLLTDALLLLSCLYQLSRDDGKPMFIW